MCRGAPAGWTSPNRAATGLRALARQPVPRAPVCRSAPGSAGRESRSWSKRAEESGTPDAERQAPAKLLRAWVPSAVRDSPWVLESPASRLQRKSKDVTVDPWPPGPIKVRVRASGCLELT